MQSISRPGAIAAAIALSLAATAARADDDAIVRWKNIVGVITEKNVSNMVANIDSGTFAWSVRSGHARVDLMTGHAAFEVEGLSINGAQFSGTPGPITDVMGTLVCNAVDATQNTPGSSKIANTPSVPLNAQGDAEFSGTIQNIPAPCNNPLFLVRVAPPRPAAQSAGGSPPEPSERLATDGAQNSDRYAFRDEAGPASSLYGSGWPKPMSDAERAGSSDRPDRLSANIEVEL